MCLLISNIPQKMESHNITVEEFQSQQTQRFGFWSQRFSVLAYAKTHFKTFWSPRLNNTRALHKKINCNLHYPTLHQHLHKRIQDISNHLVNLEKVRKLLTVLAVGKYQCQKIQISDSGYLSHHCGPFR